MQREYAVKVELQNANKISTPSKYLLKTWSTKSQRTFKLNGENFAKYQCVVASLKYSGQWEYYNNLTKSIHLHEGGFQDGHPSLPATVRHGSSLSGHRLPVGLRRRSSSAAFCHIKDVRCEANLQQLWRQVFCSCRNSLPTGLRQADISFQRFKWLLKTFLFGCWDRCALWLTAKAASHKFSYLLTYTRANLEVKTRVGERTQSLSVGFIVHALLVKHNHRVAVHVVEVGAEQSRWPCERVDRRRLQ